MSNLTDQVPVLVGASSTITGFERLLAATTVGDEMHVIVEENRPSNATLLEADEVFVRDSQGLFRWQRRGLRALDSRRRIEIQDCSLAPIGGSLSVLELGDPEPIFPVLHHPGLVVLLDGSERAAEAIEPAAALAEMCQLRLAAWPVGSSSMDCEPIADQLESGGHSLPLGKPVHRSDLSDVVGDAGAIAVASAFGTWAGDAQLFGVISRRKAIGAPVAIGVGPMVAPAVRERLGPIAIAVDGSEHGDEVVEGIGWLAKSKRDIVVLHVRRPGEPQTDKPKRIADLIERSWGLTATHETVEGTRVISTLSEAVERLQCPLAVLHSWHQVESGNPPVASMALSAIAGLRCPVAITTKRTVNPEHR